MYNLCIIEPGTHAVRGKPGRRASPSGREVGCKRVDYFVGTKHKTGHLIKDGSTEYQKADRHFHSQYA